MDINDKAAPGGQRAVRDALLKLQARDADQRLLAVLDDLDDMLDRSRAHDLDEGLDPDIVARLDAMSGREDAPMEWRMLHQRVREGRLTWEQFWFDPTVEPGGSDLIDAAMKVEAASLQEILDNLDDEEDDTPKPPSDGVLR